MTRIKIKKLLIHNFLSFQDEEWDFDNTGRLVLIKGVNKDTESTLGNTSNGAGKSALSHALMYALFGQLNGKIHNANIKNKYADTVLDGFKMSVSVDVDVSVGNGNVVHWRIVRGLMKGSAAIALQLFSLDDSGTWKDISKSSSANTQKYIEDNVLFMNFDMYQRLVMLSVDDKYNFFKLNASQKRDFVETLLDTSVYSKMYKMMCDDMKTRNVVIQNLKVNQIKLEKSKELCEDEIEKYKASVNDQIAENETERANLESKVGEFDPKFAKIKVVQDALKQALDKIRENKNKLEDVIRRCNDTITNSKIEITNCKSTISHHEREIEKHKEVLGMICDDCQKVVNKFYSLDVYRDEMATLNDKVADEENTIQQSQQKIEKVKEYDTKFKQDEMEKMGELSDAQVQERNLQFQKTQIQT